jgi:UDP-N-acetylmuramoyl-tripeptide--D-alanyl-D-alanine ligase
MKDGGTAVLNADDERVAAMRGLSRGGTVTYGIESAADVSASEIAFTNFGNTRFVLTTPNGTAVVEFPLNGRHNIMNALAAAAVGHTFGMSAEKIAASLGSVQPPPQRGEVLRFAEGFTVINDSYNSNPTALISMVETLVDGAADAKRKIVVAGEMLELGDDAHTIHRQTGETIAALGIDMLIGVRGLAADLVRGARSASRVSTTPSAETADTPPKTGGELGHASIQNSDSSLLTTFVVDSDAAAEMLAKEIREGDVVLVKGSRGVRTEKVVERLVKEFELEGKD